MVSIILRNFVIMEKSKYVSLKEVSTRSGIPVRTIQWQMQRGKPVAHVKCYSKVGAGKTNAYVIEPAESFFNGKE